MNLKETLETVTPIKEYWLVALKNSDLKGIISAQDEKILAHLTNIASKVSANTMEVTLTFAAGKEIEAGSYTRMI